MAIDQHARISTTAPAPADVYDEVHRRGDWLLMLGAMACGTFLLGPVGLILIVLGCRHLRRAQTAGVPIRDWRVTIIALFCLIDAGMNLVGWSVDTFAHDTLLGQTLWMNGYGRIVDAGYYLSYNSRSLGGTAFSGEKALQLGAVLFLFPMRVAVCWGFLKMKRWGLQGMIITSWMYAYLWLMYLINLGMDFNPRLTHNLYGMLGWWGINGWFVDQMVKSGFYRYDPTNYHGPLHFYVLFLSQTLFGRNLWALRMPTKRRSCFRGYLAFLCCEWRK